VKPIACHCCICLVVAGAMLPAVASAQEETRAALIAAAQATKAQQLVPYAPGKAERIALAVKRQFLETPEGFYPWLESVYSGGGFTLGAGYRSFYGDRTFWTARGLLSAKAYKRAELATESLGLAQGRVDLRADGGWRDATQVNFYGVGNDTAVDARANYRLQQTYVGGSAAIRGPGPVVANLGLRYEDFTLESGRGTTPSIEDAYTPETAPGLGANPTYLRMTLAGGIDSRPAPGYARRGGLYALTYDGYFDQDDTYSFDLMHAEIVQHVPVLRENWVLSFHGVATTTLGESSTVPYFLLPSLGSGSTLRAYPSWRFRDRHSLLLSGEFRWIPNRLFLDMAIFYDTGKVASRREDLNFTHLKHNWGIGARFHSLIATPLRIDLARGSEGFNLVFSGAAAF
jgi:hypothetical protein